MKSQRKERKGLCIGVLSGDRVLFQGPIDPATGAYRQKILHLSGITAPKFDPTSGKDQKYGYAARQFLRTRLVGQQLDFVIQKTINGIELGHILYKGKDITIELLKNGYVKLRDKVNAENIDAYKDAEEDAKISQFGMWTQQGKNKAQYRFIDSNINQKDIISKYSKKPVKVIVEEIHPSKVIVYFPEDGFMTTINFSEIQVVVLSEKLQNGQTKSNVRVIRGFLEGQFLNREVELYINSLSVPQNMLGYLINNKGTDVRKLLLENGFAKLGKDAMSGIPAKQFLQLKAISQTAVEKGKGLWKEHKVVKTQTTNEKGFQAIVLQVHSGDSLTLLKQQKNEQIRVFFPNVRAPSNNQPYSFDSKQALRKKCAGAKVRVQIQFTKKINVKKAEGQTGQLKNFTFASVFLNNQNLSQFMLSLGLISIQAPKAEDDISKYFEILMQAEGTSKKQKKGIHKGGEGGKLPHFNDLSGGKGKKIDATKCKNMFQFIQDDQNLVGVVQIVLNGSRFKIRFTHQNLMAICVLDGVRSLPNEGDFKKVSQQALIYSKLNAMQRDVELQLKRVDLKGVFHIKMIINKRDYALDLLENGLAICKEKSKYVPYVEAQNNAKKNKKGLWKYDLNLGSLKGETQKQFKSVNFNKNLILLQVFSGEQFYLDQPDAKKPKVPQNPQTTTSVVIGGFYAVKFTDDVYYRAKILRQNKGLYYVHYVDFGNYDSVEKKDIGILPEDLKKVKSSLYKCSLYGLDNCTKQSANLLKDLLQEKVKAQFKQQSEDNQYRVILTTQKNEVINEILLEQGEAQCIVNNPAWEKIQEQAKKKRLGKWAQEDD